MQNATKSRKEFPIERFNDRHEEVKKFHHRPTPLFITEYKGGHSLPAIPVTTIPWPKELIAAVYNSLPDS